MNLPKAYIKGFLKAGKSPRLLIILYLANIFTALFLALPFMDYLKSSFGSSQLSENLLDGFDRTVFSNLIYYNKSGFFTILGSIKWIVLAFFILNIFLTGGIIRILNKDKFSNKDFFSGASFNFFRFLGTNLITIFFQILFAAAIYFPLVKILQSLEANQAGEITYYIWVGSAVIFHLLIFIMVSMIGDYAKFNLEITNSFNIFKGFWKSLKYVFTHFFKSYFLYISLLILPVVIMYVYLYFEKDIKMATGIGILIVLAMQQAFILLRVFLRVWILASQFIMYEDDYDGLRTEPKYNEFSKFVAEPPAKVKKKAAKKTKQAEAKAQKVEKQVEMAVVGSANQSEYAIDFDKTFSESNKLESDEPTFTEEEMVEKLRYEEQQEKWLKNKNEEKIMRKEEEIYNEENYVEPPENIKSDFEEDETEEIAECEDDAASLIEMQEEFDVEKVHQNVTEGILLDEVNDEDLEEVK